MEAKRTKSPEWVATAPRKQGPEVVGYHKQLAGEERATKGVGNGNEQEVVGSDNELAMGVKVMVEGGNELVVEVGRVMEGVYKELVRVGMETEEGVKTPHKVEEMEEVENGQEAVVGAIDRHKQEAEENVEDVVASVAAEGVAVCYNSKELAAVERKLELAAAAVGNVRNMV